MGFDFDLPEEEEPEPEEEDNNCCEEAFRAFMVLLKKNYKMPIWQKKYLGWFLL